MKNEEYYQTAASVDEYIKMAEDHSGQELILKLKDFLPPSSSILEIGSGPGTDWEILCKDFNVTGSDNSTEFLSRLAKKNPQGKFQELDAVTLDTDETFNAIYSNKVLHHLRDHELEASIQRQYEILNSGGIFCHSFWKGEDSEVYNGLFVNYHSEADLGELFAENFEILLTESYKEFDYEDSILVIGRKR